MVGLSAIGIKFERLRPANAVGEHKKKKGKQPVVNHVGKIEKKKTLRLTLGEWGLFNKLCQFFMPCLVLPNAAKINLQVRKFKRVRHCVDVFG
jgi:hypothetical protein